MFLKTVDRLSSDCLWPVLLGYSNQMILLHHNGLEKPKRWQIINHNWCGEGDAIFSLSPFYKPSTLLKQELFSLAQSLHGAIASVEIGLM